MRKQCLSLVDAFHFINERRYIWPKFKIMSKLNAQEKNQDINKGKENELDLEFDKLAKYIQDQKKRVAGRHYKIKN